MYTLSVVGAHNVGKTTYCEKLIQRAKKDGFKVAAVKSSSTSLDLESTDTKRLMKAGAEQVVFTSPDETAIFLHSDISIEKLFEKFHLYPDLLLIEGQKSSDYPKFVIARDQNDLNVNVRPQTVKAVVCPTAARQVAGELYPDALLLHMEDTEGLYQKLRELYIDYYVDRLPKKDCRKCGFQTCEEYGNALKKGTAKVGTCPRLESDVRVSVDSKELTLSPYPRAVLSSVIRSLVETLSGVPVGYKRIDVLIQDSNQKTVIA
jgi:molybdopterin-guanine dinucleotide biosynthesis protein B